jgi:TIR domain
MYQVAILDAMTNRAATLQATLEARMRDLQLDPSRDLEFLDQAQLDRLSPNCSRVGVLFSDGPAGAAFGEEVQQILDSPAVVVPAVTSLDNFTSKVPPALYPTNGLLLDPADPNLEKVAGLVLEILGLLRKRRRLFISYKRSESAEVAQQLYHALDERSFDVFLDTLSVRSADDFQEQLWHRMTDSDVVVLLYTQSTLASGWVEQEIERATGMKVTVLQLIWPGVTRDRKTELFEAHYLTSNDFAADDATRLRKEKVAEICTLVESLRAVSLSRRKSELVGTLQEIAKAKSLSTAIQSSGYVDVRCDADKFARVLPSVGVPDSETIHSCALNPVEGATPSQVVLLYDGLNVTARWRGHLDWLSGHLPVRTVKLEEVNTWLGGLCQ